MVTDKQVLRAMGKLMAMPFFPASEPLVKMALAEELPTIAADDEKLNWLIQRVTRLFNHWPGLSEVRAVYCSKYKPLDGIEAHSGIFPNGIPSESDSGQSASTKAVDSGPEVKELPSGSVASADKRVDAAMRIAVGVQRRRDLAWNAPATQQERDAAPEWLKQFQRQFE